MAMHSNKDRRGRLRGACLAPSSSGRGQCHCDPFEWTPGSSDTRCEACGHYPLDHEELVDERPRIPALGNGEQWQQYAPAYAGQAYPFQAEHYGNYGGPYAPYGSQQWQPQGYFGQQTSQDQSLQGGQVSHTNNKSALAQEIKNISTRVTKKGAKSRHDIYQPRMNTEYERKISPPAGTLGETCGIRKLSIGDESDQSTKEVVILLVGATGSGKTTFLNALANYLFGVQREDDFRFEIVTKVDECEGETATKTSWVSAYVFNDTVHKNVQLTVVDTPGFGHTSGMEGDRYTTRLIREWLKKEVTAGMEQLSGICFFVKNSETRCTLQTVYEIRCVTRLFGKDIEDNIVPVVTFCNGANILALQTLKEQSIEFTKHFTFNNSDEDDRDALWKSNGKSYNDFCSYMVQISPTNVDQTTRVLRFRDELEVHLTNLQKKLGGEILLLEEMRQHVAIIRRCESEMESNKDYKVTVLVPRISREELPNNRHHTNCIVCSCTCCESCPFGDDDNKRHCPAMDKNGYCRVCPKKCHWQEHRNLRFFFKTVQVEKSMELDELREKYDTAKRGLVSALGMLKPVADKFMISLRHTQNLSAEVRGAVRELKKIAMCSDSATDADYAKLLIRTENDQRRPGYAQRIEQLTAQLHMAELMAEVGKPNFDPFSKYKADPSGSMKYLANTFPEIRTLLGNL